MKFRLLIYAAILLTVSCGEKYVPPAPPPPPPPQTGQGTEGSGSEDQKPEIPFKNVVLHGEFTEDFSETSSFLRFAPKTDGGQDFRYYSGHPSLSATNTKVLMMRIDPMDDEGMENGPRVVTKDYTFYGSYSSRIRIPDIRKAQKNIGAAAGIYVSETDEKFGHGGIDFELRIADPTKVYLAAWTGKEGELNRISRTIDLAKGVITDCSYGTESQEKGKLTDEQNKPDKIAAINGFDASEKFYIYGFDWHPDRMTWWIRKDDDSEKMILWDYKGKVLFPDTYARYGIPVLPAHYATCFMHTGTRVPDGMKTAKEKPEYPFEMEIDWMSYKPFDDLIEEWKENASKQQ